MKKLLSLLVLLTSGYVLSAQNVAVSGSADFDLSTSYHMDTLTIPLKIDQGQSYADFHLVGSGPTLVRFGGVTWPVFQKAVAVKKGDQPDQLLVTFNLDMLAGTGKYDIEISYYVGKDAAKISKFNFTVNRPAAVIESTSTLTAGLNGSEPYGNELLLRESSGRAGIPHLQPSKLAFDKIGGADLVHFLPGNYCMSAGGYTTFKYKVDQDKVDELPVGVYSGKIYFTSPSIANGTFTMNVEIANKRGKWLIFVIVIAGLLSGFGIRILLKNQTESEQARLTALVLQKQITDDVRNIHDADLQADVQKILHTLQLAFQPQPGQTVPPAAMQAVAVTTARTDYNTKRAAFDTRYQAAVASYDQFAHPVFDADLSLILSDRLKAVRAKLLLMKGYLDNQNVKDAMVACGNAGAEFTKFAGTYQLYIGTLIAFINGGAFWSAIASPGTKANLGQEDTKLITAAAQITPASNAYQQTLITLQQLQQIVDGLGDLFYHNLLGDYQATDTAAATDPAFLAALKALSDVFPAAAANEANATNAAYYYQGALLQNLNAAWTAATAPVSRGMGPFNFGGIQPPVMLMNPISAVITRSQPHPVNYLLQLHGKTLSLNAAISQSNRRFILLNLLQMVLLTLVISLLAYKLYGDAWIGKWPDMIGLFLGAFSADIATDSISTLKSKLQ
jgi:hypothetical protein